MIKNKVFSSEDRSDWRFRTWKSEFIKEKNLHIIASCLVPDFSVNDVVVFATRDLRLLEDLPPTNLLGALKVICSGDGLQWFPFNLSQVLHKAGESLVKSFIFASAARRNFSFPSAGGTWYQASRCKGPPQCRAAWSWWWALRTHPRSFPPWPSPSLFSSDGVRVTNNLEGNTYYAF